MKTFVNEGCEALAQGSTLLFPTDTIWGIGCDATNSESIKKVYSLKKRKDVKALICLVSDFEMLELLTGKLEDDIKKIALASKPTTVIYPNVRGVAADLKAENGSVGIRIVQDEFCRKLIERFGKPIVSTSANMSGSQSPKEFKEIDQAILEGVDHIVTLKTKETRTSPSTLILIDTDGNLKTLRA
tara:strand:+ start:315 stop:872 length:558 start_codon:yes stop_codon:yes gene_type:complete